MESAPPPEPRGTHAPATGSTDPAETELQPDEEPTTTGTLFIMLLFLMALGGMWFIMYLTLLSR